MESLRLNAMAKINLGLDVLRRRADGYHEVKMVMQTVGICDELEFTKLPEDCIRISTDKEELPSDEHNLIYRAAKLMKDTYGICEGVSVKLQKNIPIAAGMAGGSTDAAATIHGMDRLFGLKLSLEEKQKLGVKLGADVPYCLMGGTALSEGIGEVLTALPAVPEAFLVVAKPDINVSTKFVYENLHADSLTEHPDIDGMVESIRRGDLKGITDRMEFHFHLLRHAFASRCIREGCDMKSLSELLGHSSVQITMNIYVHSSVKQKKELVNQVCRL